ncbi:hypothetical protein G6F57_021507 [Rhizopus arrhizus]|nr:hypothetical protein G6F22_014370 [Rhizopus arrhizus]KAG1434608.1 hypothetical protein G6F57_021507 [Rhizopus arrhizus]
MVLPGRHQSAAAIPMPVPVPIPASPHAAHRCAARRIGARRTTACFPARTYRASGAQTYDAFTFHAAATAVPQRNPHLTGARP